MNNISEDIKNIVSLIDREKPEELRLFRKWIKHFFYGNDEISEEIVNDVREIEEVKDMLSTTLKKRDKIQFEQGIEQGIEKGIEEAKKDNAVKMLKKGYPINEIADITGLSVEVIRRLKKDFN